MMLSVKKPSKNFSKLFKGDKRLWLKQQMVTGEGEDAGSRTSVPLSTMEGTKICRRNVYPLHAIDGFCTQLSDSDTEFDQTTDLMYRYSDSDFSKVTDIVCMYYMFSIFQILPAELLGSLVSLSAVQEKSSRYSWYQSMVLEKNTLPYAIDGFCTQLSDSDTEFDQTTDLMYRYSDSDFSKVTDIVCMYYMFSIFQILPAELLGSLVSLSAGRGRGRRGTMEGDSESEGTNPVLASMAQLLERQVDQTNPGNGQSSGRMISQEDPQERFGRQQHQEFCED
ncbi:hypothetical protein F511_32628 [Dorcoceras hygrometricum]|uniref:Uncharacterized protein n=1 Tax=Dorcoceras hygrometricum TaxID=472368 RepID=A0A2Z7CMC9_9LAMI|nr:hypothetical protein F511_32628 [Dorcoceras hygrometricum]